MKPSQKTAITTAKTDFNSVDEYIASQPGTVQGALECVRSTVRMALPGAEEVISYKIPAYKLHGRIVLYFAGWRQHYSLYPTPLAPSWCSRMTSHRIRLTRARSVSRSHSPSP